MNYGYLGVGGDSRGSDIAYYFDTLQAAGQKDRPPACVPERTEDEPAADLGPAPQGDQ